MTKSTAKFPLVEILRDHDTPTICNAIEIVHGKRGFSNFTKRPFYCSLPAPSPIVGFARTASIAGKEPSAESAALLTARRTDYYRYMAGGALPAVAVVQDLDDEPCVAAWWGEINANIHWRLGMVGAITNGVLRDMGNLPDEFPILAGSLGPSHAHCRIESIGEPVNIFGAEIDDGDLIHADLHGAVVVPKDVVSRLASAIKTLIENEDIVLRCTRSDDFSLDALLDAWAEFERVRT